MPEVQEVTESVPEAVVDLSTSSIGAIRKMMSGEKTTPEEVEETPETVAAPAKAAPAVETAPAAESEVTQEKAEEKKSQTGINKRFSDLTGKIRDLEAQLANRPAAAEVKSAVATPPVIDASEPVAANFDTYEAYVKALTKYEIAAAGKATDEKAATKTIVETWNTRVAEAKAEIGDDYAGEADIPISKVMNTAIIRHPKGAYIADYLGRNPDEAARISKLEPVDAAVEIGAIAAGLTPKAAPEKPKPATVKTPPKPPAIVTSGSTPAASTDISDPSMSMERVKEILAKNLRRR
jgi:hypothetical protein